MSFTEITYFSLHNIDYQEYVLPKLLNNTNLCLFNKLSHLILRTIPQTAEIIVIV